jgi:hypothetical protein
MEQVFIKCPECGEIQLHVFEGGIYFQCTECNKIQHNFPAPLKALSIKQPWAWLIVNGYKDIENRNTLKNFRGDFLIHAGLQFDKECMHKLDFDLIIPDDARYNYGGIIGHATITDSITKSDSPWFSGKYAFVMKDQQTLPFTPCKGKLSFFNPEIL